MVAKKNIIEGAAHGSSGASELKTRKAGLLTSAKKAKSTLSLVGAFFLVLPLFGQEEYFPLIDTNQSVTVQIGHYEGSSLVTSDIITTLSDVPYRFFNQPVAVKFAYTDGMWSISVPSLGLSNTAGNKTGSLSYNLRPVKDNSNGLAYPYKYFPSLQSLYRFIESCYASGIASSAFIEQSRTTGSTVQVFCNVDIPTMFAECLSGTNGAFRSSVVDLLSSLRSTSSASAARLDDISNSLLDLTASFEKVNFYEFGSFDSVVDFASSSGSISSSHAQSLKDTYSSLAGNPAERQNFEQATRQLLSAASRTSNMIDSLLSNEGLSEVGKEINKDISDAVSQGFSASAHVQGATTNLLQKMTNITDQIKKDLQAWRTDATNRLEKQWEGIKKIRDNSSDTAAGVASIVHDGVKINGPVEVTIGTDNLNVDIANTDLDSLISGFADGSDAAIQRWLDEWELFKDSQLPYMSRFSSFIRDNTNILSSIEAKLDFGFTNTLDSTYSFMTNGLEIAISNGVAGIGLNLTNELWEYYFDRFKKANEFKDDGGLPFSVDLVRHQVFGSGFDESRYRQLDWFSRAELLLYQIAFAETNDAPEAADIQAELEDVADSVSDHAEDFVAASVKVVSVFNLLRRFADSVKLAFTPANGELSPMTSGIVLLQGGSWLVNEPLVLNVPVPVQNALRLVFQCIWYLGAFVLGWRAFSAAWDRVVSVVRWLWSVFDV